MQPDRTKYASLLAAVASLALLGSAHGWSIFTPLLQDQHGFSATQTQFVFNTSIFSFCILLVFAGRWQDRFGPRLLAYAAALVYFAAYGIASHLGQHYLWLWLSIGVLGGLATAIGYSGPIATVVKWFPGRRGLAAGLVTAGFAVGPILLSAWTEPLLRGGWRPLVVFRVMATVYAPALALAGFCLRPPEEKKIGPPVAELDRQALFRDRQFWMLFFGMFCGTFPYLMIMGNVKPLGASLGVGAALSLAVSMTALGNVLGRICWGHTLDRIGRISAIIASQIVMLTAVLALLLAGRMPSVFLLAVAGVGFCYGSCFAIYPATVADWYGPQVLGTVFALIMAAQAFSSLAPTLAGRIYDRVGAYEPALVIAAAVALVGLLNPILWQWQNRGRRAITPQNIDNPTDQREPL